MEDIDSKLSAINNKSKDYYSFASSYERFTDEVSEDEDVDTIVHRYDPPSSTQDIQTGTSLAEEIKNDIIETKQDRPQPPPDLLISTNSRRKIRIDPEDLEGGADNDAYFSEDWEMILELEPEDNKPEVDVVIRDQPTGNATENSNFYRNARRLVVHHVQGVEMAKPKCDCCILQ